MSAALRGAVGRIGVSRSRYVLRGVGCGVRAGTTGGLGCSSVCPCVCTATCLRAVSDPGEGANGLQNLFNKVAYSIYFTDIVQKKKIKCAKELGCA